jgi:hypothetical protein
MSVAHRVSEILSHHVTLELEGIDRMYLNLYVPQLQMDSGVAAFFRRHRGDRFASSALMAPISRAFVAAIEKFSEQQQVPLIHLPKGQRKDEIAEGYRKKFEAEEGVVLIGKAQEKSSVFRTQKRRNPQTGASYPWIVRSTAMVNQYYFYCIDRDFGPFFLKFSSYFPYNGKLCLNGHEYLKRQLQHEGIVFTALDNGLLECADPQRAQQICDELTPEKIDLLARKWLRLLPHPFTAEDRQAGYRYDVSILQAEFSLTQVLDRPVSGRIFFEEVLRENLDLGRPDQVQLIFDRRVTRKTPGSFRTRVITEGVIPSLHVDYKSSRIKQYFKEGRALRTEATVNNTRDFGIGKRLLNLPALRQIGFPANRRLLDVQRISQDCSIGEEVWQQVVRPRTVGNQKASALRFEDSRVQALLSLLVHFSAQLRGFSNQQVRLLLAPLLGSAHPLSPGQMSYDLRRLRLHGLIERIPRTHRYRTTALGLRVAFFFCRTYSRLLRPGLSCSLPEATTGDARLRQAFNKLDQEIGRCYAQAKLAA